MLEGDRSELQELVKETLADPAYEVRVNVAAIPSQVLETENPNLEVKASILNAKRTAKIVSPEGSPFWIKCLSCQCCNASL